MVLTRSIAAVLALLTWCCASLPAQDPGQTLTLDAYAEWRHGDLLVVDGQLVRTNEATQFKGSHAAGLEDIRLGDEVRLKGIREGDGTVLATELEAKVNGDALFESDVVKLTTEMEDRWLEQGMMFEPTEGKEIKVIGKLVPSGRQVDRVRTITQRLLPPYVQRRNVRVHVVDTKEWNAAAMGNGALWVYTGLMDDLSDGELAIVLGHELAHYTHEHSRRAAKSSLWIQLLGVSAAAAAEAIDNDVWRTTAQVAALASMVAALSGYSRNQEDQADRVGLRYVYEAGFDVRKGPALWGRFRDKYGDSNRVLNFFLGSHSRPTDRIRNIERELALNYQ